MAIVRAITSLGSSLGIRTTAEGVETEKQLELLRNEGCTEMQGYLLSRPMPASAIANFLTSRINRWHTNEHCLIVPEPALAERACSREPVEAA